MNRIFIFGKLINKYIDSGIQFDHKQNNEEL